MKNKHTQSVTTKSARKIIRKKRFSLNDDARRILSFTPNGCLVFDLHGEIYDANESYCQIIGYSLGELQKLNLSDLQETDEALFANDFLDGLTQQKKVCFEVKQRTKKGEVIDFEVEAGLLNAEETLICAFLRDVTKEKTQETAFCERKLIEEALKQSEERYRAFIENSTEGIWCFESEEPIPIDLPVDRQVELIFKHGYLAECNDAMAKHYGQQQASALVGKRVEEFVERSNPTNYHYLRAFVKSNYSLTEVESSKSTADGNAKYFLNNLVGVVENRKLVRAWGTQHDITVSKQIEKYKLESENHFHEIADNVPVLIWTTGVDKQCNYFNQQWLNFTGQTLKQELSNWIDNIHPEDRARRRRIYEESFDNRKPFEIEYRFKRHDGIYRWMLDKGVPRWRSDNSFVGYMGSCLDITDLKIAQQSLLESEEQLRQSQKIEAIGRLAGGIAHDFNNFLAVVMLHIDMLNLQLPAESPLRYRVNQIKTATNSAAGMVRQLLAFGRKQMLQPRTIVLNHTVLELGKILRRLLGEDIELDIKLDYQLGVCFVDPDQMMQVLMNLIVNARDAMPDGGKLTIQTKNVRIDKRNLRHKSQQTGQYVQLTVIDTGIGMDAKTKERVFEPFFTTKEPGKGTGLGMATAYGIVKQSGGYIWIESEPGKGSTFTLQFPLSDEPFIKPKIEEPAPAIPVGTETVLLVEDEEAIRGAANEVLNVLGYQVLIADNGVEALKIAHEFGKPIDLLLTDVVMPKMNGRDLAQRIRDVYPQISILFMSGYTDDIIARHGVLEEGTNFIQKPFAPSVLATKIREIIEAKEKQLEK